MRQGGASKSRPSTGSGRAEASRTTGRSPSKSLLDGEVAGAGVGKTKKEAQQAAAEAALASRQ